MILAVALLVLGPTKLPELARSLGRGIREFRRATEDFKSTIDEELHKPDQPPSRGQLPAESQGSEKAPSNGPGPIAQPSPPEAPTVERKPEKVGVAASDDPAESAPVTPEPHPESADPAPDVDDERPRTAEVTAVDESERTESKA